MTLSAPPEQMLREPVGRPVQPSRRVARIAGIFMLITFISIPALPLYDRVLNHTSFVAGGGGDTRVYLGALFEILTLIGSIGMAVTLFPVLRRQSERLALGYVTMRVVESCLIAVGIVSLLAVITLRQGLAGGATDSASLILTGRSLVALGIYLVAKGFKPSAILYDDGRHSGVDGPLVPGLAPSKVVAPVVAAS